jgi:DNA polymerase-3 subunit alpha
MRKVNKKVLESLIQAGAFDLLLQASGLNRASLFASIENLIQYGADEQSKAELGQSSLFDDFKAEEIKLSTPVDSLIKKEPDWPLAKRLLSEKQVLGFFVSGHPMENWQSICKDWLGYQSLELQELAANAPPAPESNSWGPGAQKPKRKEVRLAGIISEFKEITTKKGSKMAFMQVEDLYGRVEVIAFPEFYSNHGALLNQLKDSPEPLVFTGDFQVKEGAPKVLANAVQKLEDAHGTRAVSVVLEIDPNQTGIDQLRSLKQHVLKNRGKSPVQLLFISPEWRGKLEFPKEFRVEASPQFAAEVNRIFGRTVARLH